MSKKTPASLASFALIECTERIPCDPCVRACPRGAITKESVTSPPELDSKKCTGCGQCIALCPGLAIFVVKANYSKDQALVMLPYEMLPLPSVGENVQILDINGNAVGEGRVVNVRKDKNFTNIVSLSVRKDVAQSTRSFRVIK